MIFCLQHQWARHMHRAAMLLLASARSVPCNGDPICHMLQAILSPSLLAHILGGVHDVEDVCKQGEKQGLGQPWGS